MVKLLYIPVVSRSARRTRAVLAGARGFTIVELMIAIGIISLLAVLALTAFGRYRARSQQAEVMMNLRGVFVTELAYYADHKRFSNFNETGFKIEGSTNRYTYRSEQTTGAGTPTGVIEMIPARIGLVTPDNTIFAAASSATSFTVTATANLDSDPTVDQWHVSEIPPDTGAFDVNDVNQ
ncbi:MAG: prepilin-type N-terminal cleavage/methylation domain-containing protein [Nitrospiraceae bacterium]|nr:prepilin-type N-terminal cleavage/methylation domain-containing protein [Nitrospiraceae bacterium]